MLDFLIFFGALIALFLIGFLLNRRLNRKEFERKMKELTMPCGELVPSDGELMVLTDEELDKFGREREDIDWLINYVGHKMHASCGQEHQDWGGLYTRLSKVKTKKGWYKEPYDY